MVWVANAPWSRPPLSFSGGLVALVFNYIICILFFTSLRLCTSDRACFVFLPTFRVVIFGPRRWIRLGVFGTSYRDPRCRLSDDGTTDVLVSADFTSPRRSTWHLMDMY